MEKQYLLTRYSSDTDSTLGVIHAITAAGPKFVCFTLEDEHREVKLAGETRISRGTYQIKKRHGSPAFGWLDDKYDWHDGMLWLQDVPNFTWIYIHGGSNDDSTDGCLLVGDETRENVTRAGRLRQSPSAYQRLYKRISKELEAGFQVSIEIRDWA